MESLYESLLQYGKLDKYPFHMPGHKRRGSFENPFLLDITEIDGFDNLHHAEGILRDAQRRTADLYGSEETYFLVNGSTCGILSAVSAAVPPGGKLLMARNCHKAAYHSVFLRGLEAVYLYPETEPVLGLNGGITPEAVKNALKEHPDIRAVLITSPTYDGVVSDVSGIARAAHEKGIPLIVDEAHGAHFGFHPYFPESSVRLGADLVIHSLHKTLPSFTQTALLHVNGPLADRERLRRYLEIYQTSSPSYLFMAGMDRCTGLLKCRGRELFEDFKRRLEDFYGEMQGLERIRLAGRWLTGKSGIYEYDPSKLVLSVKHTSADGNMLSKLLREEYGIELEMAAGSYALALSSIADTEEGFDRLKRALKETDGRLEDREDPPLEDRVIKNETVCKISEAMEMPGERISLSASEGRISREFLFLYPPGIPLLVPGERISRQVLDRVRDFRKRGYQFQGLEDYSMETIQVAGA